MSLFELPVGNYLEELASNSPAPGGGTAAALSGAQGAGLVRMVAELTLGNYKYSQWFHICREVSKNCEELYLRLMAQMQLDADAYFGMANSYRMPKETPEEISARSEKIREATAYAAYVPLQTMTMATEALEEAARLIDHSNPNCASDLGVAAECLRACVIGAYLNVRINVNSMKYQEGKDQIMGPAQQQYQKAMALYETVSSAVSNTIG